MNFETFIETMLRSWEARVSKLTILSGERARCVLRARYTYRHDERVIQTVKVNALDKFELGIRKVIESFVMQRMPESDDIVTRYMDDADFQKVVFPLLTRDIYRVLVE